jgi:chemotaxis protein histidine kinase CheA/CheY-like chemotaxis protein
MEEIFALFRAEGREHVTRITELLLAWEHGDLETEGLEELFRAAHSLKGAASTLGVDDVAELAHAVEDVFGGVKRGEVPYAPEANTEILAALDEISNLIEQAAPETAGRELPAPAAALAASVRRLLAPEAGGDGPPAGAAAAEAKTEGEPEPRARPSSGAGGGKPASAEETVRLPVDKLDTVIDGFSELWEEKFRNDEFGRRVGGAAAAARAASKTLEEALEMYRRRGEAREFFDRVERSAETVGSVDRTMRGLDFDFHAAGKRFELDLESFGDELGRLRMAPLRSLFRGFRRPVRDLALKLGKSVRLDIIGEENELDKTVIELIKDPLNHVLRNALLHGIEKDETRRAAGKPPEGHVLISSTRIGSRLLIEVEDDGRGLDLEQVKKAALAEGVIHAEAVDSLSPEEATRLIFEPGVTTLGETVTAVGGRGVGLDIVATNVAALGGTVDVWSEAGVGTRFTIQIPLTIATARGMLVEAAGRRFIVPASAIRRAELVSAADFETVEGKPVLRYQGRIFAAGKLAAVLDLGEGPSVESRPTALLLSSPSGEVALLVSEVRAEGEFLTKNLGPAAALMPYFGAAHVTGEGEVVLILNPDAVIRSILTGEVTWRPSEAPAAEVRKQTVLVVDDSLTTRVLEKNILEAAGYEVLVATDGDEALELLNTQPCDLAIVDIQMPRMDGYELTRRIRASSELRDLPVVVVTSMDTEREMARGLEAGADAYIKKSRFDQREFLEVVGQFI